MFIVQTVRLDYDDYPIGMPYNRVGPFNSLDEAKAWICETYGVSHYFYARDGRGHVQIENILSGVTPPEEFVNKRAVNNQLNRN